MRNFCNISRVIVKHNKWTFEMFNWISTCKNIDKIYRKNYMLKGLKIFNLQFMQLFKNLILFYNSLISKVKTQAYLRKKKVIVFNLISSLGYSQIMFLESFGICIYYIYQLTLTKNSKVFGLPHPYFTTYAAEAAKWKRQQLLKTRYGKSTKKLKIKSYKPSKTLINFFTKQHLIQKTKNLNEALLVQLITLCYKNYKIFTIKKFKFLVSKKKFKHLWGIVAVWEHVLRRIVVNIVQPLLESQNTTWHFRKKKSMLVLYIYRQLYFNIENSFLTKDLVLKITKKDYANWSKTCRIRVRGKNLSQSLSKRRRTYFYTYWAIARKSNLYRKNFGCCSFYNLFNVNLTWNFNKTLYISLLQIFPLVTKYKFLLKHWLFSMFYTFNTLTTYSGSKSLFVSNRFKKSLISSCIYAVLLYGVKQHAFKSLKTRYTLISCRSTQLLRYTLNRKIFEDRQLKIKYLLHYIRADTAILLFSNIVFKEFLKIFNNLILFLKKRGLLLCNSDYFFITQFLPGIRFTYLGFTFLYAYFKTAKLSINSRVNFIKTSLKILWNSNFLKSQYILLWLGHSLWKVCKLQIKSLLCKKNSFLSLSILITSLNNLIQNLVTCLGLTSTIRLQLKYLDKLIYIRLRQLLKWKFKSKPSCNLFVRKLFYNLKNRVNFTRNGLLKTSDFTYTQ